MVVTPGQAGLVSIKYPRSSIVLICGLLLQWNFDVVHMGGSSQLAQTPLTNRQLRQQKIMLDAALGTCRKASACFDADGRIVLFNGRFAKWMGLPPAILQGLPLLDLIKSRKAAGEYVGEPQELAAACHCGRARW